LWSAGEGNFTFRGLTPEIKTALGVGAKPVTAPQGYYIVDFRTKHMLVDFNGGKTKTKVGQFTVADESSTELLILREDGKIEVRREAEDTVVKERKDRENILAEWLKQVSARKDKFLGGDPMGGGSTSGTRDR
jgi:hypothetical protein